MYSLADHLMHALLLAVIVFLVLRYVAGQSNTNSINNSVLVGVVAIIYMLVFGMGVPNFSNLSLNF